MKASIFYRIAAVLLLLFAVGHTLGFRQSDPKWGVDTLIGSMRSIHFNVQGFSRTYWDLFVGAGLFVSVFLLFAAVLAWALGGLPAETFAGMRGTSLALALQLLAFDAQLQSAFDLSQLQSLYGCNQGRGASLRSGATGATDAVDEVLRHLRHIVVDNVGHVVHMQTA